MIIIVIFAPAIVAIVVILVINPPLLHDQSLVVHKNFISFAGYLFHVISCHLKLFPMDSKKKTRIAVPIQLVWGGSAPVPWHSTRDTSKADLKFQDEYPAMINGKVVSHHMRNPLEMVAFMGKSPRNGGFNGRILLKWRFTAAKIKYTWGNYLWDMSK